MVTDSSSVSRTSLLKETEKITGALIDTGRACDVYNGDSDRVGKFQVRCQRKSDRFYQNMSDTQEQPTTWLLDMDGC